MKKVYVNPSVEAVELTVASMICGSQDVSSDKGIGYGGVDDDGDRDPSARRRDVWGDDEQNED